MSGKSVLRKARLPIMATVSALFLALWVLTTAVSSSPARYVKDMSNMKPMMMSFRISEPDPLVASEDFDEHGVLEGRRALRTAGGVPADGLLLAEANSDRDNPFDPDDFPAEEEEGAIREPHRNDRHWHKALQPLDSSDYITFGLSAIGLMLAAAGGIGGGGILVPVLILITKFSPKYAAPLSSITIFGGAITNTLFNMQKRHPLTDKPLVDWDLILVMEPLTIAGALVGSFVQKILPDLFLTTLMIVLMVVTANRMLFKGIKLFKKETEQQKELDQLESAKNKAQSLDKNVDSAGLLGNSAASGSYGAADSNNGGGNVTFSSAVHGGGNVTFSSAVLATGYGTAVVADEESAKMIASADLSSPDSREAEKNVADLKQLLEYERHTHYGKVTIMSLVAGALLAVNLLKGGGGSESVVGIVCGSLSFWMTSVLSVVCLVCVSLLVRKYLISVYEMKIKLNYTYSKGDIEWSPETTLKYPGICFFAGFFAALFGIGGGIVQGPLMLEMGVHPRVATATSAVMILFTSFTAASSFMAFGLLRADYAFPMVLIGLFATAVGQVGTDFVVKKFKRPSLIILTIGSVIVMSAVLMGFNGLNQAMHTPPGTGGGGSICESGA